MIKRGERKGDEEQIEGQSRGRWERSALLLMFPGRIRVQEEVSKHAHVHSQYMQVSAL